MIRPSSHSNREVMKNLSSMDCHQVYHQIKVVNTLAISFSRREVIGYLSILVKVMLRVVYKP